MNTRQLALFASFSTLDYVLGFIPLVSLLIGYLMLPMFRILMGWRLTITWMLLGFFTSIPSIIQQSSAAASTAPAIASNPIHLTLPAGIWLPYWSPFIGFLQYESGLIPPLVKAAILIPVAIYAYIKMWSRQIQSAKRTLIQIPQLRSWGYFTHEDFEDWRKYTARRDRLKKLHGLTRLKAAFRD